jgi:hypothetical protein
MSNYQLAADFILRNATNEDLNNLVEAIKMRRSQITRRTVRCMTIGDTVQFTDRGTRRLYKGTVDAVKIKNIIVNCGGFKYSVPASMLSFADA